MIKRTLQISALIIAFSSCSSIYHAGQTPDDVYYSPAQGKPAYVETQRQRDTYNGDDNLDVSERYLRMKRFNRNKWEAFDYDYNYWNDPYWNNQNYYNNYSLNSYIGYGPRYNSVNPFHAGYYGTPVVIMHPIQTDARVNTPRNVNLNTYSRPNSGATLITDPKTGNKTITISSPRPAQVRTFSNGNVGRLFNSIISEGFSNSSSGTRTINSGSNPGNNSSSSSSNSSSSSSSSSSSGGSAPVRTFPKGGNNN